MIKWHDHIYIYDIYIYGLILKRCFLIEQRHQIDFKMVSMAKPKNELRAEAAMCT